MDKKILSDIRNSYKIEIKSDIQINGGWKNRLWKATDGTRDYIVKSYSTERFTKAKLQRIEEALQRQTQLEGGNVPFPHIYLYEGKAIRFLDEETYYMVMDLAPGRNETAETITLSQLESLGSVCAGIHKGFAQLPNLPANGAEDILGRLEKHFQRQRQGFSDDSPVEYQKTLQRGEEILKDLSADAFDRIPRGCAHEDFTPDNLLFDEKGVTAVLDFDRNCYGYPLHDVGRAVLSFALELEGTGTLNIPKIEAFMMGYASRLPLTWRDVADALRVTWGIEFPWWISPGCFTDGLTGKAVRYRREIQWLTFHWNEINGLQKRSGTHEETEDDPVRLRRHPAL